MAVREHGLFRLLERPPADAAMGGSLVTGSQGPCVDTGQFIDFVGTVVIDLPTLKELAEVAGFSVNEEGIELERRNAELEYDLGLALWRIAELDQQLDTVALTFARARGSKS